MFWISLSTFLLIALPNKFPTFYLLLSKSVCIIIPCFMFILKTRVMFIFVSGLVLSYIWVFVKPFVLDLLGYCVWAF
ncbi:hypothetical protein L1987_66861 [Smallanthus sonchifolius]|uniref:Uncharacterized protein n=1 Tax=Smallanthus sonchifolius TaxID=185202 RepID=A0ACB9BYA6_9ASTR|nr:hypothetical protein L1987_66861 [Smallanthus sonchifolius]